MRIKKKRRKSLTKPTVRDARVWQWNIKLNNVEKATLEKAFEIVQRLPYPPHTTGQLLRIMAITQAKIMVDKDAWRKSQKKPTSGAVH